MEALLEQRTIALWLLHLKRQLALNTRRRKVSDGELASVLKRYLPTISSRYVNELINFSKWPNKSERHRILEAINSLVVESNLHGSLTIEGWRQVEDEHRSELPEALQDLKDDRLRGGIVLGELVDILKGGWLLSYVSPTDRSGNPEAEVRQTLLVFKETDVRQTELRCEIISGHTRWHGRGFAHDEHMLIEASELNKTDSVSFIVTRPKTSRKSFIGLGLALQRSPLYGDEAKRPILSILTFGEKIAGNLDEAGSVSEEQYRRALLIVQRIENGNDVRPDDIEHLRAVFIKGYDSLDRLFSERKILQYYKNNIELNDNPLSMLSLRLKWAA